MSPLNLLILSVLSATSHAFLLMGKTIAYERCDPIVNPGLVSGHLHSVIGGNKFACGMTDASSCSCSSMEAQIDCSNYWTPPILMTNPNGTYTALPLVEGRAYYFNKNRDPNITVFPDGFRMLAGDAGSLASNDHATYMCQQGGPGNGPEVVEAGFPKYPCLDFLRASIEFPSCWDGVNIDVSDHKSHMSYPSNGKCDPGHPYLLPVLTLELGFDTKNIDPASWILSTGSTTGGGLHADFFNGWNRTVLQAAMRDPSCMDRENIFGDSTQCQTLLPFRSTTSQQSCRLSAPIPKEPIPFPLALPSLPGCNLPWSTGSKPTCTSPVPTPLFGTADTIINFAKGGESTFLPIATALAINTTTIAKPATTATVSPTSTKAQTSFSTPSAVANYIYKGCYSDSSTRVLTSYSFSSSTLTLEKCASICSPLLYFGVENGNECYCSPTLSPSSIRVSDQKSCSTPCTGNALQPCGGGYKLTLYEQKIPIVSPIAGFGYVGCYVDSEKRVLGAVGGTSEGMTGRVCVGICAGGGWGIAGVENGNECFCGNTLDNGAVKAENQGDCDVKCKGGEGVCGGGWRVSVYRKLLL